MTDFAYQKFVKRWEEVMDLPTQTVGPFTSLYKRLVSRLKIMPWPVFLLMSIICVVGMYVIIGSTVTLVASLLQKGF